MFLLRALYKGLISLKLAVFVVLGLALSLIISTSLESAYDTPTAQYFVYRSTAFHYLLLLLGLNIFFVAVSRYPWKKHHAAFLCAHSGILLLLGGAWVTDRFGLDGSMRVAEGEQQSVVEIDEPTLFIADGTQVKTYPVKWVPPMVKFKKIEIFDFDLVVDQMMSHADVDVKFVPSQSKNKPEDMIRAGGALLVNIQGGPMQISQDFWLWAGDASTSNVQAGPAILSILTEGSVSERSGTGTYMNFIQLKNGDAKVTLHSAKGVTQTHSLKAAEISGKKIKTPWFGGIELTFKEYIPRAERIYEYRPSITQFGPTAPPSAIHLVTGSGGPGSELWLGLYDRATLQLKGREVSIAYAPRRVVLPFSLKLERFNIERYEGTNSPKSYSSLVSVMDGATPQQVLISMNEPHTHKGLTFYQSSYEDAMPRPTVSIFSVNRDPGRTAKYTGSIALVLGVILLFRRRLQAQNKVNNKAGEA